MSLLVHVVLYLCWKLPGVCTVIFRVNLNVINWSISDIRYLCFVILILILYFNVPELQKAGQSETFSKSGTHFRGTNLAGQKSKIGTCPAESVMNGSLDSPLYVFESSTAAAIDLCNPFIFKLHCTTAHYFNGVVDGGAANLQLHAMKNISGKIWLLFRIEKRKYTGWLY